MKEERLQDCPDVTRRAARASSYSGRERRAPVTATTEVVTRRKTSTLSIMKPLVIAHSQFFCWLQCLSAQALCSCLGRLRPAGGRLPGTFAGRAESPFPAQRCASPSLGQAFARKPGRTSRA